MKGPGLRPKVKVACPCGERLTFTCFYQHDNSVNWVLSPKSNSHLGSCSGKEEIASGTTEPEQESRGHVRSAQDSREGIARDQGTLRLAELQAA